jgi:hypothetical protein
MGEGNEEEKVLPGMHASKANHSTHYCIMKESNNSQHTRIQLSQNALHFLSMTVCVRVSGCGCVCVCVCVREREREREMITQDMSNAKWVLLENRCDDRMR